MVNVHADLGSHFREGIGTLLGQKALSTQILLASEKRSILKGKNLLLLVQILSF